MSKQRNLRKRRAVDDEDDLQEKDDDGQMQISAEEIKLLQKQRLRKTGVESAALAVATTKKDTLPDIHTTASGDDGVLQAAFNKERKLTTEADDPEMKKYVETQLAKRLGKDVSQQEAHNKGPKRPKTVDEQALEAAVPKQKEYYGDPGAAFVAGVTEVPLGFEHKLKNIEATEAAKSALLVKDGSTGARAVHAAGNFRGDDVVYRSNTAGGGVGTGGGGFRRVQFPVRFGKMEDKDREVLAAVAATKASQRARALEKKQKRDQEFKGFF